MAHKDIRIKFEVEGEPFEAVGFLNEGEFPVIGDTALERTSKENGGAIGEEDWAFLNEHQARFPTELHKYRLAANRRSPSNPRRVSYFDWNNYCGEWFQFWHSLDHRWYSDVLVLRRCKKVTPGTETP